MSKFTDFLYLQQEIAQNIIWASEAIMLNMGAWRDYVSDPPDNERVSKGNMLGWIASHSHNRCNPQLIDDFITDWKLKNLNQFSEIVPIGSISNSHNIITPDGASYEKRPATR